MSIRAKANQAVTDLENLLSEQWGEDKELEARKIIEQAMLDAINDQLEISGRERADIQVNTWPLIAVNTRSNLRIESLSAIIDSLVDAVEAEGDAGELEKRALFQLEQLLVEATDDMSMLCFLTVT